MENRANASNQNGKPVDQNPVTQPTVLDKPKVNFVAIFAVGLICSLVFGVGGYLLGKQSSRPTQVVDQNEQRSTNNPIPMVYPSNSPTALPESESNNLKTFNNSKVDITFEYPTELSIDPNQSPRFYTDDPYNRWIIVLKTKLGDEINIQSGGPADWGDCKKRLDEKTFTTNVKIDYFKETLSSESYCEGSENYIGWYAYVTKDKLNWFISLTTKDTSQSKQAYLEPLFLNLIKSFKTK